MRKSGRYLFFLLLDVFEWTFFVDMYIRYIDTQNDVSLVRSVGSGAFGEVFEGRFQNMRVAVKRLHHLTDDQLRNFEAELTLMRLLFFFPSYSSFVFSVLEEGWHIND